MPSRKKDRFPNLAQGDLFADPAVLFPVPMPKDMVLAADLKTALAQAISKALHDDGRPRREIARQMRIVSADDAISEFMLNHYASPGKDQHDIPMTRLNALIRVTGAHWLLNVGCEGLDVSIQVGADVHYTQRGMLERQREEIEARIRSLALPDMPATVARGRK